MGKLLNRHLKVPRDQVRQEVPVWCPSSEVKTCVFFDPGCFFVKKKIDFAGSDRKGVKKKYRKKNSMTRVVRVMDS